MKDENLVIVHIDGEKDEKLVELHRRAVELIAKTAEDMNAVVICGGRDMGVMAEIGQIRSQIRIGWCNA